MPTPAPKPSDPLPTVPTPQAPAVVAGSSLFASPYLWYAAGAFLLFKLFKKRR